MQAMLPMLILPLRRRRLMAAMLGAATSLALAGRSAAQDQGPTTSQVAPRRPAGPDVPLLRIGMLLFPQLTPMDLVGPHLILASLPNTEVHLLWKTTEPVVGDNGLALLPSTAFDACPDPLDVLCVPGGPRGTERALLDDELLDFVADRGSRATYVTSVCTGSLILGAAGLLSGYRASSYWGTRDILPVFGAIPVEGQRVVVDGNRITGGGVTAGIDFGLYLSGVLRGEANGRLQELLFEYDPQPPFGTGSPTKAPPATLQLARTLLQPTLDRIRQVSEAQARKRLSG